MPYGCGYKYIADVYNIQYAYTPITLHANGKDSLKFKEALEMTSSHRFN